MATRSNGPPAKLEDEIAAVREFNRAYTRQIGALNRDFLDSPFSLAEVRVLREIYYGDGLTASAVGQELGLDAGYLSRMLRGFARRGLLTRQTSPHDGRQTFLSLSRTGCKTFEEIEGRQRIAVRSMLDRVDPVDRPALTASMRRIQRLLGLAAPSTTPFTLRAHRPGDMGWIIHRQGALYFAEYGWNEEFEALVAEICARFIQNLDPKREKCWIAERDGEIVGAIFCVTRSRNVAQLRLLYVEPSARGLGLGSRLVEECIAFARRAGYRKLVLWTNSVLRSARRIYEANGFTLTGEEKHTSFGHHLVSQTWALDLRRATDASGGPRSSRALPSPS